MASNQTWMIWGSKMKDGEINTGKHSRLFSGDRIHSQLLLAGVFLSLLVLGCEESKYSQCKQIFYVAQNVTENTQDIRDEPQNIATLRRDQKLTEMKRWLEAARTMNRAARNIMALEISNAELSKYRHQLATVYSVYAQATYDAVKARENKNIEALKAARTDAEKAGAMQQSLVKKINIYCLNQ